MIAMQLPRPHELTDLPPAYAQPQHLTSFSYDGSRNLLLPSSGFHDHTLRLYKDPPLHADLRRGFEQCVWRDERIVEGLDSLLKCLLELPQNEATDELFDKTRVITWRGMMTRLTTSLYQDRDDWEMNAQVIDGVLYLEQSASTESWVGYHEMTPDHKMQSYFGYSFESYCTTTNQSTSTTDGWNEDVNTHEQWCSVVKSRIGTLPVIIGGEVDCVLPSSSSWSPEEISTEDFVELKTNINIESTSDEQRFEKNKLLKFYMQSFLLGVPRVVVGFRTREGILTALQKFRTLEIPLLVKGKQRWDAAKALQSGLIIINFLLIQIGELSAEHDERLRQAASTGSADLNSFKDWPVFRVRFQHATAQKPATVAIRPLAPEERSQRPDLVGTVISDWFQNIIDRRVKKPRPSKPVVPSKPPAKKFRL